MSILSSFFFFCPHHLHAHLNAVTEPDPLNISPVTKLVLRYYIRQSQGLQYWWEVFEISPGLRQIVLCAIVKQSKLKKDILMTILER
jgi:hypothetical protein